MSYIDHIDGDPRNNDPANLRLVNDDIEEATSVEELCSILERCEEGTGAFAGDMPLDEFQCLAIGHELARLLSSDTRQRFWKGHRRVSGRTGCLNPRV